MTRLTQQESTTIRTFPQQTKLYLSVFQPRVVFKARVNGAISRGARIIPFDTVTLGSYLDLRPDCLLLIGSADGRRDIGSVRVRDASSIELTVAENSDINWADDLFLTGLFFFRVDAKYPRITHDPNNFESVVFWKDYNIAYTNQNSIPGTLVNAGSHRAIFRDCASGLAETYWSSTGTQNMLTGTTYGFQWTFEGGTPSSSTAEHPGIVTYNAPGHYVTTLSVSGTNGAFDTTYRYVSVYDYPGCGTGTPPLKWEFNSLDGSRSEGGWSLQITLHEIIDISEGDVVVIFTEDWYGDTKQSLGGNYPQSSSILFSGYVLDDSIKINYRNSTVEFEAGSISAMMKQGEGFSCSVESKANPTTWFELLDMDVRRATYHYLKWHTTVLNVADVQFLGTDRKIQFFDADRGSIYDAIDSLIRSALLGSVVSDRQSKLWLETDAYAQPNATGTFLSVMDISKGDWINEPRIDESLSNTTSFIEMGGIAYSGSSTGTFSALMTNAPGDAPSYRGKVERTQGLALYNQSQLNQLSGDVFAFKNARYPVIDMDMSGNFRNLDIAPQEAVQIDIAPEDNMRGKRISSLYQPISMQWDWDARNNILVPHVTFNIITSGEAGQTIPIPDIPPGAGFDNTPGGKFTSPTFPMPSFLTGIGLTDLIEMKINDQSHQTWVNNGSNFDSVVKVQGSAIQWDSTDHSRINMLSSGWYLITISCRLSISLVTVASVSQLEFGGSVRKISDNSLVEFLTVGQLINKPNAGTYTVGFSGSLMFYTTVPVRYGLGVSTSYAGGNINDGRVSIAKLST